MEVTDNLRELALKAKKDWFAYQDPFELEMAMRAVRDFHPKVILEIGVAYGASLACWAEAAKPSLLIGIDPMEIEQTSEQKKVVDSLISKYNINWIKRRSTAPETPSELEEVLAGQKVDFMFIDGNHGYDDVNYDWLHYRKYLNSPALVGFHDIYYSDQLWDAGSRVSFFWDKIKAKYKYNEFYNHSTMGIGMIYV